MALIDIFLPAMGEGVIEATITQILLKEGDEVEEDDSILEIATDKVDSEIPAPEKGVIANILVKEGDLVKVGQLIAKIEIEGKADDILEFDKKEKEPNKEIISTDILEKDNSDKEIINKISELQNNNKSNLFLSPLVKSMVSKEQISLEELEQIKGTGFNNRITKDDILAYLSERKKEDFSLSQFNTEVSEEIVSDSGDEIIEMDRMRKLIAEHMLNSVKTAPHVSSFIEADVTAIVNWRNRNKDAFLEREGEKLTYMPIFVEAMAKAVKDFPMINISVKGDYIIKKKNINIGMATALPSGNLIVPVIKNADQKDRVGLAKIINDLANRSRNNKLQPDEIQGSTITITNIGSFGNMAGTPIINQPNVAILSVGAILKKPAVIETSEGDAIAIRHKMILSLAYDHRVVDGALGGMFLKRVSEYLENFNAEDY